MTTPGLPHSLFPRLSPPPTSCSSAPLRRGHSHSPGPAHQSFLPWLRSALDSARGTAHRHRGRLRGGQTPSDHRGADTELRQQHGRLKQLAPRPRGPLRVCTAPWPPEGRARNGGKENSLPRSSIAHFLLVLGLWGCSSRCVGVHKSTPLPLSPPAWTQHHHSLSTLARAFPLSPRPHTKNYPVTSLVALFI